MSVNRIAAAGAVLMTLAACSTTVPSMPEQPAVPERSAQSPTSTPPFIRAPVEYEGACTDQPWSAVNPPFAGAGPHLIAPVAVTSQLPDDTAVGLIPYDPPDPRGLPYSGDESVLTNPMTDKLPQVQLLACIKPTKGKGPIGEVDCTFTDPPGTDLTFPLYQANYEVTVREARTGRVVTTLSVPGTVNGSDNCPTVATDTGHTVLLRAVTRDLLIERLRPLATAPG